MAGLKQAPRANMKFWSSFTNEWFLDSRFNYIILVEFALVLDGSVS